MEDQKEEGCFLSEVKSSSPTEVGLNNILKINLGRKVSVSVQRGWKFPLFRRSTCLEELYKSINQIERTIGTNNIIY